MTNKIIHMAPLRDAVGMRFNVHNVFPLGQHVTELFEVLAQSKEASGLHTFPLPGVAVIEENDKLIARIHPLDRLALEEGRQSVLPLCVLSRSNAEVTMVTVASPPRRDWTRSAAIGLPTMLLRPTTTTSAPLVSTPLRSNSSMTPAGVHDTNPSVWPMSNFPTFSG